MARSVRARQGGGGHTYFRWENQLIGYAQNVSIGLARPVAQAVAIQPLNAQRPLEIMTSDAMGAGTITMTLIELYNASAWQRLKYLANSQDLADIMRAIASIDKDGGIVFEKMIMPPPNAPGYNQGQGMVESFFNCVVTDVADDEPIAVDTMQINKDITVMYTYSTKNWINASAFQFKDRDVRTGEAISPSVDPSTGN